MPAIKAGTTLTKDDLNAFLYVGGNLSDPFSITYTLYESVTGQDVIIGLPERTPIKFATGSYYAPWTIPQDEPVGAHKIVWRYKETATSDIKVDTEEFKILSACTGSEIQYSPFVTYLINQLRIKLRDINPDRDYHFSAPSQEQSIAGFTKSRGYRWADESLYSHLWQASNYINLYPPDTAFGIENYPAVWQPLLLLQAMSYALWDMAILWINEEFSYSLNGISLDIQRSDKYQSAASSLQDQVNQQLEIAKKRIHIIKGLAQDRYTFSRGAALGPWCLHRSSEVYDLDFNEVITIEEAYKRQIKRSYSMSLDTGKLVENGVTKIWMNGKQELYKMSFDNGRDIITTKTHKFFNIEFEEIEQQYLEVGDVVWVKGKNELVVSKILSKEYFGEDETFDMEMNEPFRNYIANDIVVHNTGGQNIRRWISGSGGGNTRIGF